MVVLICGELVSEDVDACCLTSVTRNCTSSHQEFQRIQTNTIMRVFIISTNVRTNSNTNDPSSQITMQVISLKTH
jgi:hypothetical protein